MIKIYLTTLFFFFSLICDAQNWQWAKQIGSNMQGYAENSQVISDGSNIYVIGSYAGDLYLPNDTLHSNGSNDLFVAKFDASGNNIWSKTFGGNFNQITSSEDVVGTYDPVSNDLYVTGTIIGLAMFDTIPFYAGQSPQYFVARMDLNGNFKWVRRIGGSGLNELSRVFVNPYGKIYVTTIANDSLISGSFHIGPGGGLWQFDSLGNCLSALSELTWPASPFSNSMLLNFIGTDLIIAGGFRSASLQIDTAHLINHGDADGYIARTDSMGNVKWIRSFGGSGSDVVQSLGTDSYKNVYFSGVFKDSINIDSFPLTNNGKDILIGSIDENGNLNWLKQGSISATSSVSASFLIVDGDGNSYITGSFSGVAMFGTNSLSTVNSSDMFITRYNINGDCLGVRNFGVAYGSAVAIDNNGSVYCNGVFQNTVNIVNNSFTSFGGYDIYLAKIDAFTGIGESERINYNLVIYANPTTGMSNITVPNEFIHEKNLTLQIFDITGKVIQQKIMEMNNEKIKLNLINEAKGVYNVTLTNGKKIYSGKIIFE